MTSSLDSFFPLCISSRSAPFNRYRSRMYRDPIVAPIGNAMILNNHHSGRNPRLESLDLCDFASDLEVFFSCCGRNITIAGASMRMWTSGSPSGLRNSHILLASGWASNFIVASLCLMAEAREVSTWIPSFSCKGVGWVV